MGQWDITGNFEMKRICLLFGIIALSLFFSGCCLIMPTYRTSTVTLKANPETAKFYYNNGNLIGTGTVTLSFDCKDSKDAFYNITVKAYDYNPQTVKIYNLRENYEKTVSLEKVKHFSVSVTTEPSVAEIYNSSGKMLGVGSCSLDFTENHTPESYYELQIRAPYCYDKTVKVYKKDVSKHITLTRKPIKKIVTVPDDADIYVNNEKMDKGSTEVNFENIDKVLVTVSRIGYETESFVLLKSNPQTLITYELDVDEAYENSEGGESASQYANKWVPIKIRQGMSEDEAWTRMISIVRENFEQIEKTDKASGWIKTFPIIAPYKKSDVRTTLEIVPSYSTGEKVYKVRLLFEKRKKNSGEEGWSSYERLMKQYKNVIPDLLNTVGEGM